MTYAGVSPVTMVLRMKTMTISSWCVKVGKGDGCLSSLKALNSRRQSTRDAIAFAFQRYESFLILLLLIDKEG